MQSISIDSLSPDELREALAVVSERREREQQRAKRAALLAHGTDDEIIAAAKAEYWKDIPITLANRYDDVASRQEVGGWSFSYHPRRPVFMRGAKWVLIGSYSSGRRGATGVNAYARCVFRRCVRLKRITALSREEIEEAVFPIKRALKERYNLSFAHFDEYLYWHRGLEHDGAEVIVGGKDVWLGASELANVRALKRIIAKTTSLEKRMELAREHMRKRLAA